MATFKDLIRKVKSEIREVSVEEAQALANKGAALLDVREADDTFACQESSREITAGVAIC